ncbi:hypothetical protein [Psychroflexus sediminis]|uniref:Lipoprotein n=1 Tax=Psychroflexus sediminis TaxID=470826 RepID=A0A1G7VPV5_9FLAO|nr:hypothetical protein [Psychroflexus sediminis]SDG61588.1 hypothetical protein SAMN04488027_10440 [Psychroflexus sediminis]
MKLKNTLLLISFLVLLISCNDDSIYVITDDYEIDIQKASGFHNDFTNRYEKKNLMVNAERINLKELFAVLIKTDSTSIKVKSKEFKGDYFTVLIEQKSNEKSVRQQIIEDILNKWDLKLTSKAQPTFKLQIQDTAKFLEHRSNSENETSRIFKNNNSIKIKNTDLSMIAKLMNSEFSKKVLADTTSERINYSFKRNSFEDLKAKMEKELGIEFTKATTPQLTYIIESK